MKRALIIIFALALLLLSGCESLPGGDAYDGRRLMKTLSPRYKTELACELGELKVSASIDSSSPDSCTIAVNGPEHLSGYTWEIREEGARISYRGLSAALDPTGAAAAAPLFQVVSALSGLLRPGPDELPVHENGLWTIQSQTDAGGVLLALDEEGVPVKLLLKDGAMEITLQNFVFF
ncbi:MAG: hypothetical protein LBU86_00695 [Oscillospiraceae bacterium]|jgi:hypothetical protein|nr:hypothetical protein [Oscillospiraceae bacterium]